MGVKRINYSAGIHLSEFKEGDSIHIRKTFVKGDQPRMFLCEFISWKRGYVTVRIIGVQDPKHDRQYINEVVRVKQTDCYLWGAAPNDYRDMKNRKDIRYRWHSFAANGYIDGEGYTA